MVMAIVADLAMLHALCSESLSSQRLLSSLDRYVKGGADKTSNMPEILQLIKGTDRFGHRHF